MTVTAALLQGRAEALPLAACLNELPSMSERTTDDHRDLEAAAEGDSSGHGSSGRWRLAGYTSAEEAARWRHVSLRLQYHMNSNGAFCKALKQHNRWHMALFCQHFERLRPTSSCTLQVTPGLTGGTCVGEFEAANGRFRTRLQQVRITAVPTSRNLSGWQ